MSDDHRYKTFKVSIRSPSSEGLKRIGYPAPIGGRRERTSWQSI